MSALWSKETEGAINLGKGHPNPSFLPMDQVENAVKVASAAVNSNVTLMQYGPMQGSERFRTLVADWLARATGRPDAQPRPEHILATNGSGPAMAIIAQLYTKPGDDVFVDAPGYFLAYYTFADCKVNVVNVPTDAHGMNVDVVEERIAKGQVPAVVYTVPIGNNPTGVSMSEERKKRLVELSHKHNFKIISDEVYQFLYFNGGIPTSLFEYDDASKASVFAVNSFSKLLGPGLRLGWVATHAGHMTRLLDCGSLQSGGGLNPFMGGVVCELLESGFVTGQVERVREAYAGNSRALCEALDKFVGPALRAGERLEYRAPSGGFFCFVALPERFVAGRLLARAKECGVTFFEGPNSSPDKKSFSNCVRLCFAFQERDVLVEGVKRLAEAIRTYE